MRGARLLHAKHKEDPPSKSVAGPPTVCPETLGLCGVEPALMDTDRLRPTPVSIVRYLK